LLILVLLPVHSKAATTSLEAILAQGAPNATQICSSTGGSSINTFTLSSKECLQSGSTQSGPGTGSFTGEARAKTTYGVSTPSNLALSVFAKAESTVSADFQGLYDYNSQATDTFLDQITVTGGPSGQNAILEVVLNIVGDITVTGNGASDSASLKITVSSPDGFDDMEYISPMNINDPMVFEVPYKFDISGEFKILVEAFAGQNVNGPFSATQTVNFEQTVTLDSVSVKDTPNGDVISDTGFEYPVAPGPSGSQSNIPPTAKINSPKDDDSFPSTDDIFFHGTGTDSDSSTEPSLSWTSDVDGILSSEPTHSKKLSPGDHVITLKATDSRLATGTDSISISVTLTNGGGSPGTLLSDSFEVAEWNGLGTENAQNDWFRSTQRSTDGTYSAEVDGSATNATLTSAPIDLQGKTSATVTFDWFIERGFDSGEFLAFDVSTDGGAT
jgi:hypothetical protein